MNFLLLVLCLNETAAAVLGIHVIGMIIVKLRLSCNFGNNISVYVFLIPIVPYN